MHYGSEIEQPTSMINLLTVVIAIISKTRMQSKLLFIKRSFELASSAHDTWYRLSWSGDSLQQIDY